MAAPATPSLLVPVGIGALLIWRFYSRVRRMVGRQRLSNVRPWLTLIVFPVLIAVFTAGSIGQPATLIALAAGAAVGAGLGMYGLRVTRFENTPEGMFYTPSAHLGIALSLLLLGRILYRVTQIYWLAGSAAPPLDSAKSPLTLLIFGTLAGYYVMYAIGLLRWRYSSAAQVARVPPQG